MQKTSKSKKPQHIRPLIPAGKLLELNIFLYISGAQVWEGKNTNIDCINLKHTNNFETIIWFFSQQKIHSYLSSQYCKSLLDIIIAVRQRLDERLIYDYQKLTRTRHASRKQPYKTSQSAKIWKFW